MKKVTMVEFLKLAFDKELYFLRSWRIRTLMRLYEYPENNPDLNLYLSGRSYVFNLDDEVIEVECDPTTSPLKWGTELDIPAGFIANIESDIKTTYGKLLLNTILFASEFDNLIPYHNEEFKDSTLHRAYSGLYNKGLLTDSRKLIKSASYLHILEADSEFGVPAASMETFTTHPDMKRVVAEQLELHKDSLDDPTTHAKIDAVTTKLDREYVKGTQAEKFLISGKMHDVVRKKTKIMYGSETGLDGLPTKLIATPLEDGVSLEQMPSWVDAARMGSLSRGGLTASGGYEVKNDERGYGHLEVSDVEDCKAKHGLRVTLTDDIAHGYVGFHLTDNKTTITDENLESLKGTTVELRAPSHCILEHDYCKRCMGTVAGKKKYAISNGVSTIDSNSMSAMMAAAHGKASKANDLSLIDLGS